MSEKYSYTGKNEKDDEPDWGRVFNRIEELHVPNDLHERAQEIAELFSTGKNIEMFGCALHDVPVPDVPSFPVDRKMTVIDPENGDVKKVFPEPSERLHLFEHAANLINQLSNIKRTREQDDILLMRIANVVSMATVLAHSYENGNGRLARVLAEIIRYGTENPDQIKIIGTERDVSQSRMKGFRIFSYLQKGSSIDKGDDAYDVINAAASVDIPLSDKKSYSNKVNSIFTTTHDLN